MKKKVYIKPTCEVVAVNVCSYLLTNSGIGVDNNPGNAIEGRINMKSDYTDIHTQWATPSHIYY